MSSHVILVGALRIVLSLMTLVAGLILWALLGGTAEIVPLLEANPDPGLLEILGIAARITLAVFAVLALPGIVIGLGLLAFRPWARVLGIVYAILDLTFLPLGTAWGIYSLWVLFHRDAVALCHGSAAARA